MIIAAMSTLSDSDRSRIHALAVGGGLTTAGAAIAVRLVSPRSLLGPESALLAAGVGLLLAAVVGRYEGNVLIGVLTAAVPVFAVDAVSTALREPITIELVVRAAGSAA